MKSNIALIAIIVALIAGAGGFFGGMKYQQSKQPAFFRQFNNQSGRNGNGQSFGQGRGNGFRPVNGQITSADDKSITVKMNDGSSRIVILSDSTQINKTDPATSADLKVGDTVAVFGTDNSDGSVTAQTIQLNPIQRNIPSLSPTQ